MNTRQRTIKLHGFVVVDMTFEEVELIVKVFKDYQRYSRNPFPKESEEFILLSEFEKLLEPPEQKPREVS